MCKINPLLEEVELSKKINSAITIEELPYVFHDSKMKDDKLQRIEQIRVEVDNSSLGYAEKSAMRQKVYAFKYVLGLKEGNDYVQSLVAGGIGFVLGIATDEGLRNYVRRIANEFVRNLPQYSKS